MTDQNRLAHPFAALPLQIETLLDRPAAEYDADSLRTYLAGRTVLVTGAGGSIGRELSRQLTRLGPAKLVLIDFSEFNLFHLEHTLLQEGAGEGVSFRLIDVRDGAAMDALFRETRPDVVFHAAAYKHVPMMERHPIAAFENNTLASIGLLHRCEAFEVDQFIFISTDKAVAPASVMGTTKRLTEWYVRAASGGVKTKTVRFGNVFGSVGSVVPLFMEQIAAGGPVTVTHPDMERYFMSVHDACCLILQTLLFDVAPVYTLRMDPAVNIRWLAGRMIERLAPGRRVDITYTGIRPGEKLQEQLWSEHEQPVDTGHRDIVGLRSPAHFSRAELDAHLAGLVRLAALRDAASLRGALFDSEWIAARV